MIGESELWSQLTVFFANEILPTIKQDGGDVELIEIKDSILYIEFKGACIGCPFSLYTLILGIQTKVQERFPSIKKIVTV